MKFFNKKEQVIDLQLTQYGKQQLSKGKFKPTYYAFYDDGILYDSQWANVSESQNSAQERIKEVPTLETQYNFSSIEERVKKSINYYRSTKEEQEEQLESIPSLSIQNQSEKDYALTSRLGTSKLTTTNIPAWDIKLLSGEISSSTSIENNSNNCSYQIVNIPQLRIKDVEYQIAFGSIPPSQVDEYYDDTPLFDANIYGNETITVNQVGSDLIIEIDEKNTPFFSENFGIEIFEVSTEPSPNSACAAETREVLVPLYFQKKQTGISNNIVSEQGAIDPIEDPYLELDPSYVEYYFDVFVDDEIDDSILCKLTDNKGVGTFNQRSFDCKDEKEENRNRLRNLFKTDVSAGDLEDCDDN